MYSENKSRHQEHKIASVLSLYGVRIKRALRKKKRHRHMLYRYKDQEDVFNEKALLYFLTIA